MDNLVFSNIADISSSQLIEYKQIGNYKLFSNYYREYYNNDFVDHSFCIFSGGKVLGYIACCQLGDKLCFPGSGIHIELFLDNDKIISKLIHKILQQINCIAQRNNCSEIIIKDQLKCGMLSPLGAVLLNEKYQSEMIFEMIVSFDEFYENKYFTSIRKSYKSLVNWGEKNLDIKVINNSTLSRDDFLAFQLFHSKISGRKTRSDESWNIQYQMLEQGFGELILGYHNGALVAGSLFLDQHGKSIYATGVYERSLFEFGLSHYLLYYGICRSYARGTKIFSIGDFATNIEDSKLYNIQFFKKGFSQALVPTILWSIKKNLTIEKRRET